MCGLQIARAVAHWELNCLGSFRRRVAAKFAKWAAYVRARRVKNRKLRTSRQVALVEFAERFDRTFLPVAEFKVP